MLGAIAQVFAILARHLNVIALLGELAVRLVRAFRRCPKEEKEGDKNGNDDNGNERDEQKKTPDVP